jgi:hypothetical protein
MSAYVLTLLVDGNVGGVWYWTLRCWDDDVQNQYTLATGSVKSCLDPQVALAQALYDGGHDVLELVSARWVLMT